MNLEEGMQIVPNLALLKNIQVIPRSQQYSYSVILAYELRINSFEEPF